MRTALLMGIAVVLSACTTSIAGGAEYEVYEFGIDGPRTVSIDTGTFSISNVGDFSHTFVVTGGGGDVVFAGGVLPAGETAEVALDLDQGSYMFTCRLVVQTEEGELIDHYEKGMNLAVEVTG